MIMDPRGFGRWRPQVPGNLPPGIYSNVVNLYVWLNTNFFYFFKGAVPPGARFDPFGPPEPDAILPVRGPRPNRIGGDPDPDHLPPPN